MKSRSHLGLIGCLALSLVGRGNEGRKGDSTKTVVVYSALDREFAEPAPQAQGKRAGVDVVSKFDIESTRTVGLAKLMIQEPAGPRCDRFWNNEILKTLRLGEKGLLAAFRPAHADDVPETFKAKDGTWYGFAARPRIFLVNTKLVAEADRIRGINDMLDPKWEGKIGIAKPLAGTTAAHAACPFAARGVERASASFRDLKVKGVQVLSGDRQVATAVSPGQIAFGLTDTDDAMGEILAGQPVTIVYPDREPDGIGTLYIPDVLAITEGAPHREAAEALASHLLSPEVEATLAEGPSVQIPLLTTTRASAKVETPKSVHAMPVDFEAAARIWEKVAQFLESEFTGG